MEATARELEGYGIQARTANAGYSPSSANDADADPPPGITGATRALGLRAGRDSDRL